MTPSTQDARATGLVERLVELCDAACSNAETALNFLAEAGRPGLADTQRCYIANIRAALAASTKDMNHDG